MNIQQFPRHGVYYSPDPEQKEQIFCETGGKINEFLIKGDNG